MIRSLFIISIFTATVSSCSDFCIPSKFCKTPTKNSACAKSESCCKSQDFLNGSALEAFGCGQHNVMGKSFRTTDFFIKSNNFSYEGRTPWVVQIRKSEESTFHCSGALIKPNVVLTAASCVYPPSGSYVVRAGQLRIPDNAENYTDLPYQDREVAQIFKHTLFNGSYSNIAVVPLKEKFVLTLGIIPICLPSALKSPNEYGVSTSHEEVWSEFAYKNANSDEATNYKLIKYQLVTSIPHEKCVEKFTTADFATDDKICGKIGRDKKCTQQMYQGSPLSRKNKISGNYELIGLGVSDKVCEINSDYRVYTFVPMFIDFVELTLNLID